MKKTHLSWLIHFLLLFCSLIAFFSLKSIFTILITILFGLYIYDEVFSDKIKNATHFIIFILYKLIIVALLFLIYGQFISTLNISEIYKLLILALVLFILFYTDVIVGIGFRKRIRVIFSKLVRMLFFSSILILLYLSKIGEANISIFTSTDVDLAIVGMVIFNLVISLLETILFEIYNDSSPIRISANHNDGRMKRKRRKILFYRSSLRNHPRGRENR